MPTFMKKYDRNDLPIRTGCYAILGPLFSWKFRCIEKSISGGRGLNHCVCDIVFREAAGDVKPGSEV
jgi:hypothetical protein